MTAANQLAAWEEGMLPMGTPGGQGRVGLPNSGCCAMGAVRGSVGDFEGNEGSGSELSVALVEINSTMDLWEYWLRDPGRWTSARTTKGLGRLTAFLIVRQTKRSPSGRISANMATQRIPRVRPFQMRTRAATSSAGKNSGFPLTNGMSVSKNGLASFVLMKRNRAMS